MKDDNEISINTYNTKFQQQKNSLLYANKNKNNANLIKLKNTGVINTEGKQALIIYKKMQKKNNYVMAKTMNKSQENNKYINDSGLNKKILKFKKPNNPRKNQNPISPPSKNKLNANSSNCKKIDIQNLDNLCKTTRTNVKYCSLFQKNSKNYNYNSTKKCLSDNERNKNISDLIKSTFIIGENLIKNPTDKKITQKELSTERKKKILSIYGIDYSEIDSDKINGGLENSDNEEIGKNNIKKINKNENTKSANYILSYNTKKNNNINDEYNKKTKKINKKPKIDQFEYLKKISIAQKKLVKNIKTTPSFSSSNYNKLNDSFRQKNIDKNYFESISKDDEYPYSHKKSHRTSKEIKYFLKEKKNKEKKINEEEELSKNTKIFIRYQNLNKLMREQNGINLNSKSPKPQKINVDKNNCELNEYFLGLNKSTIVDPNDYYFNILDSRQLIIKLKSKNENSAIKYNHLHPSNEVTNKNHYSKINNMQSKKIIPKTVINNYTDKKNSPTDKNKKNNILKNIIINKSNIENTNLKEKRSYSKKDIFKLIKIIKKLFNRKGFSIIYTEAMKQAVMQHYYASLSCFIAIFKNSVFRKIQKYSLNKNNEQINVQNIENKNYIKPFVEFLSGFFKMKALEKIFNYSKSQYYKKVIIFSMKILLKPHLKNYFEILKNYKPKKINNIKCSPIHKKADTSISEKMNSYIYESLENESESSISINPNSVDNDRLHQLKIMFYLRQQVLNSEINQENEINSHSQIIKSNKEEEKQKIENNISDDRNKIKEINWDLKIENLIKSNDKKLFNEEIEEYQNDFLNPQEIEKIKINLNNDNIKITENRYPQEINNKEDNEINNSEEDNIICINIDEKKCKNSLIKLKSIYDPEKISNEFTNDIINKILFNEISNSKIKIIPHKSFKNQIFNHIGAQSSLSNTDSSNISKKESTFLRQFSFQEDSLSSLNDSIMSSYSVFSVFNKTIKDKKKEHSLYLYINTIAPKLIKLIIKEIYEKYEMIYDNISTPLKNDSKGLMISFFLQNSEILKQSFKCPCKFKNIRDIIDKEKILKKFEPINKKIRFKNNFTSDNFYDNILNECLIETAIEIIVNERFYGTNGNPLKWSTRNHILVFKYRKNNPKPLCDLVIKKLNYFLHNRIGLLVENYDYMNVEQINIERGKRLSMVIKKEFEESENQWTNLEMEETQVKLEVTEKILDQFISEILEILEHIQFSRERPDLYQGKSIYGCENIPKLSFQLTNSDVNKSEDNDLINT